MATIAVSPGHKGDFYRLFGEWQKEQGGAIQMMPPVSPMPDGRDAYSRVPESLLSFLTKNRLPYELTSR